MGTGGSSCWNLDGDVVDIGGERVFRHGGSAKRHDERHGCDAIQRPCECALRGAGIHPLAATSVLGTVLASAVLHSSGYAARLGTASRFLAWEASLSALSRSAVCLSTAALISSTSAVAISLSSIAESCLCSFLSTAASTSLHTPRSTSLPRSACAFVAYLSSPNSEIQFLATHLGDARSSSQNAWQKRSTASSCCSADTSVGLAATYDGRDADALAALASAACLSSLAAERYAAASWVIVVGECDPCLATALSSSRGRFVAAAAGLGLGGGLGSCSSSSWGRSPNNLFLLLISSALSFLSSRGLTALPFHEFTAGTALPTLCPTLLPFTNRSGGVRRLLPELVEAGLGCELV